MVMSGFWPVTILVAVFVVLQSTILKNVRVFGVSPDIAFVIFLFTSTRQGSLRSEVTGFSTGLIQDFLSAGPLGLNAFVRTLFGWAFGLFRGRLYLDPILIPILMAVFGTLAKYFVTFVLMLMFSSRAAAGAVMSTHMWIEMGLNGFFAPFVLALLRLFKFVRLVDRDEYHR